MVKKSEIIKILKTCDDPELGINIVDLGLIYDVKISKDNIVKVKMTLTTPGCPLLDYFVDTTASKIRGLKNVKDALVEITFEPLWDKSKMSEAARSQLGI